MTEDTAAKKASYSARQKVNELRKIWTYEYPETVEQTFYNLVIHHIDALQVLVRLAGEVKE